MTKHIYQHKNVPFLLLYIYDSEINYHYLKRYIKFIRHFKSIEPKEKQKGFEKHHIFPNNNCSKKFSTFPNNLVLLPLRAHYIAHWLLWKAFPKNKEMMFAFHQMSGRVKNKGIKLNSRVYENLRNAFNENCPLLGGEIQRESARKRVKNGTHHLLGGEIQRESARKRVKNGTHNLLGPETNRKRVANGTHHLLGPETNRKRVKNGTHNLLGKGQITVFDIESEKCVRIPREEYQKNRDRYFNLNSKVYKEFKLRKQKS